MAKKILVVDDDSEIRELASLILRGAGYEVTTAATGYGALESAVAQSPDLVLLDVNMPEMDGWEALRLLKAGEHLAGLPLVTFTVKGEGPDQGHPLQAGP